MLLFSILLFAKILKAAEDGKAFLPGKAQRKWKEAKHLIFLVSYSLVHDSKENEFK